MAGAVSVGHVYHCRNTVERGDGLVKGACDGTRSRPAVKGAAHRRQVEIEYYSFGRDAWSRRTIDPYAVFSSAGQWYVTAFCHTVDDERLFRVDRVRAATALDTVFDPPAGDHYRRP